MAYYPMSYSPQNYGASYSTMQSYQQPMMQQSMAGTMPVPQQTGPGWICVDGEVGAKAYQIPPGTPPGTTIPLWDINDMVIYLKSVNQMGMPSPLQKLRYYPENDQKMLASQNQSGENKQNEQKIDESRFVTKDEFEKMKHELEDLLTSPNRK